MKIILKREEKIELLKAIQSGVLDTERLARVVSDITSKDFEFPALEAEDFRLLADMNNETRRRHGKRPLEITVRQL